MSPLARNGGQSWTFSVQIIKAPCCCPTFLAGNSSLGVNTPSRSGNVYFATGQTDRILVPYTITWSRSANIITWTVHEACNTCTACMPMRAPPSPHTRSLYCTAYNRLLIFRSQTTPVRREWHSFTCHYVQGGPSISGITVQTVTKYSNGLKNIYWNSERTGGKLSLWSIFSTIYGFICVHMGLPSGHTYLLFCFQ
jgi:hypothetical protein